MSSISAATSPPQAPQGAPVLIASGRVYPLELGRPLVAGNDPRCDVVLHGRLVAPRHARFSRTGRGVRVEAFAGVVPVLVRGDHWRETTIEGDGVVHLGLAPVLVARTQPGPVGAEGVEWFGMLGRDARTLDVMGDLAAAARGDAPVWLHGETGTGKECAAQALHRASPRHRGPLRALNCAALPESLAEAELFGVRRGAYTGAQTDRPGVFEEADGGTLLLDEVGDLPATIQAKLLRVLETGEVRPLGARQALRVDVRVVGATWRDLEAESARGAFRFDLLQRLSVLKIALPALRERPGDIPPLLARALGAATSWIWPDASTLQALARHAWPGNVRQLNNLARRALHTGQIWDLLPAGAGAAATRFPRRGTDPAPCAARHLEDTLRRLSGNRSAAARALGMSRSTLYRWLDDRRERRP